MADNENIAQDILEAGAKLNNVISGLMAKRESLPEDQKKVFDEQLKKADISKTMGDYDSIIQELKNIKF